MVRRMRVILLSIFLVFYAPCAVLQFSAVVEAGETRLHKKNLDPLFNNLRNARGNVDAQSAETRLIVGLLQEGSDTQRYMMRGAMLLISKRQLSRALDILDAILSLDINYTEGWNKRASVHFLMRSYGKSLADVRQTLAREPRHFGAWLGLGSIYRNIGEIDLGITAYETALRLHPNLQPAIEALKGLYKKRALQHI